MSKTAKAGSGTNSLRALPEKTLAVIAARLIREGRMPDSGTLADAMAGAGKAAERVRKLARSAGVRASAPYHRVFVSSSTRPNSTFSQARAGLRSPEFENLVLASHRLPEVEGGHNAIGFWSDGAEESRIVAVVSPDALDRVGAALGKAFKQKAILHFASSPAGSDIAHVLAVPHTDVSKIAADLGRHGIEYKTIVPDHEKNRSEVHVIDAGGDLAEQVAAYAQEAGAMHDQHIGKATYLGAETVDEAGRIFDGILKK